MTINCPFFTFQEKNFIGGLKVKGNLIKSGILMTSHWHVSQIRFGNVVYCHCIIV